MTKRAPGGVLLALDAGVRETGWAVFDAAGSPSQHGTGVVKAPAPRRSGATARVNHLMLALDQLVEQWGPAVLTHSRPSGFSITSMTAGSSSQAAIDVPKAVRSIRAPRDLASDWIGWTVKDRPLEWTGRTAARRQEHIKRDRNPSDATVA